MDTPYCVRPHDEPIILLVSVHRSPRLVSKLLSRSVPALEAKKNWLLSFTDADGQTDSMHSEMIRRGWCGPLEYRSVSLPGGHAARLCLNTQTGGGRHQRRLFHPSPLDEFLIGCVASSFFTT